MIRTLSAIALGGFSALASVQASEFAGLWAGQVALRFVTEVTVPLDENNIAVAPDPRTPTPTADAAYLRLLLHVNGSGQVSLLKDVAILARRAIRSTGSGFEIVDLEGGAPNPATAEPLRAENDIALITDERLYGAFPPQPTVRIASAAFDFGDGMATEALDAIVEAIGDVARTNNALDLITPTRFEQAVSNIVDNADVASAFDEFLRNEFTGDEVDAFIDAGSFPPSLEQAAADVVAASFFGDTRAVDMLGAVEAAFQNAIAAGTNPSNAAHNAAASFADVENAYGRFIAGQLIGNMIVDAAEEAAEAVAAGGDVVEVFENNETVNAARIQALQLSQPRYRETRFQDAVETVVDAMRTSALGASGTRDEVEAAIAQAGRDALADEVVRFPVPPMAPTPDYTAFVQSSAFLGSGTLAAEAAAQAVLFEINNNPLRTTTSVVNAARLGAANALRDVYAAAARVVRTTLPLTGSFGPGEGDPRFTYDVAAGGEAPLGEPALVGEVNLPSSHPTNPFRHRIHPDHTTGFPIRRIVRLDFDGEPGEPLPRAGFGVDRITGVYREEIFGLHKPLGQDPANDPIGLRVEGALELQRISRIDALNAL